MARSNFWSQSSPGEFSESKLSQTLMELKVKGDLSKTVECVVKQVPVWLKNGTGLNRAPQHFFLSGYPGPEKRNRRWTSHNEMKSSHLWWKFELNLLKKHSSCRTVFEYMILNQEIKCLNPVGCQGFFIEKMQHSWFWMQLASSINKQVSTNTGPRSAARYRSQISLK